MLLYSSTITDNYAWYYAGRNTERQQLNQKADGRSHRNRESSAVSQWVVLEFQLIHTTANTVLLEQFMFCRSKRSWTFGWNTKPATQFHFSLCLLSRRKWIVQQFHFVPLYYQSIILVLICVVIIISFPKRRTGLVKRSINETTTTTTTTTTVVITNNTSYQINKLIHSFDTSILFSFIK